MSGEQIQGGVNRRLMNVLALCLVCMFYIGDLLPFGSIIIAGITFIFLITHVLIQKGKITISSCVLFNYMIIFAFYCILSSFWADEKEYAIQQGVTVIEILICVYALYMYYSKYNSSIDLWKIVLCSGVLISFYTILETGLSGILAAIAAGDRLNLDFTNINRVAIVDTYGVLIALYFAIFYKKNKYLLCVPLFLLIIFASQTRKAFLGLFLGVLMLIYFKNKTISFEKKTLNLFLIIGLLCVCYYILSSVAIFEPIIHRFEMAINSFIGEGTVDRSTRQRAEMNSIGIDQFMQTPILGMGMGNPRLLLIGKWGTNYPYLHNNLIELLAGGGIIGTILYYVMYLHVVIKLIKYRNSKFDAKFLIWTMVATIITLDYFRVSYYSKETYFFLMVLYIGLEEMKRRKFRQLNLGDDGVFV